MESIDPRRAVSPQSPEARNRRFDRQAVGFLSSLVIHLVILLLLALMVHSPTPPSTPMVVQLGNEDWSVDGLGTLDLSELEISVDDARGDQPVPIPDLALIEPLEKSAVFPVVPDKAESNSDDSGDTATTDETSSNENDEGVRFFDTHAYGSKFVYVLDISGSMWAGQGRRMRRAQQELIRSIHDLQPHHSFEVILYNERAYTFGPPRLHLATRENKIRFERWINSRRPFGGTMPGDALRIAGELKPDAVFFLSDGEFVFAAAATPEENLDKFLQSFVSARGRQLQNPQANNKLPKSILNDFAPGIVVHTIALESRENRKIMQTIANEKGGQFRFIPEPARPTMRRR